MEESRVERVKRFSKIWWQSRADAGKSQEYMALGLGVSKKTIQNWEKGISAPNLLQGGEWFQLLGLNPMPYYRAFLFPSLFDDNVTLSEEKQLEEVLVFLVQNLSVKEKRELLYLLAGENGGSSCCLLQLFMAYCLTPLESRVGTAGLIVENYSIAKETGKINCSDQLEPDLRLLKFALDESRQAAFKGASGYSTQSFPSDL
ncbi:MAG: helix-turn-helix transcriptional regulator [Clostridiales bacterium]|nr:helix-turn-helix transcriptional regulator [Clostridiales bacterium]